MKNKLLISITLSLFVLSSCQARIIESDHVVDSDIEHYEPICEEEITKLPDYTILVNLSKNSISFEEAVTIYNLTNDACRKYDLDLNLVLAIFSKESDYHSDAISSSGINAGAGIGQVSHLGRLDYNRVNGTEYSTDDLFDLSTNIEISCWIYKQNLRYGVPNEDVALIAAYNLGFREYLNQRENVDNGVLYWKGKMRNYTYVTQVQNRRELLCRL